MSVTLTLGGVVFRGFEVPEKIRSGGEQMLAVHKLPGGGRVVDSMGPDDADIPWSGRFRGVSAEKRALTLDYLRRQGKQVLLTYSLRRYQVIIKEFTADFEQPYEIPYSICCFVVLDETQALASAAVGFLESLANDVVSAAGLSGLIPNDAVNSAVIGVGAALSNYQAGVPTTTNALAGVTAVAEGPLINSLQRSIVGAQTATQAAISSVTASLNTSPCGCGWFPCGNGVQLGECRVGNEPAGVAVPTCEHVGPDGKEHGECWVIIMQTVTLIGGNLYDLALEYLGDATQWNRIAQANGLTDPMLTGQNTLTIPSADAGAGGGIYVPQQS